MNQDERRFSSEFSEFSCRKIVGTNIALAVHRFLAAGKVVYIVLLISVPFLLLALFAFAARVDPLTGQIRKKRIRPGLLGMVEKEA
ncbi:hypothetical protein [Paraburkholderia sediminicola]|uniref:hypothetical protein n=1 Tax=Paraburkholderia sediminicola TaxID=458836 RepID=UPI001582DBBC|nr:hypothetical protein [Paraburkholderia sediminicola]